MSRRELLEHLIVLNEAHLRRLLRGYVSYYHQDRTHDALGKETPEGRHFTLLPGRRLWAYFDAFEGASDDMKAFY